MATPTRPIPASTRPRRHDNAFTIVEVLVVIGIIALIIGLLFPALSRSRDASRTAKCNANIKQAGNAMEMYASENRDWYPRALPLLNPQNHSDPAEWQIPWPPDVCPVYWQSCYPSMLVPYMGVKVNDSFNYFGLPAQFGELQLPSFRCPSNDIPINDLVRRKCGFPLDYGLVNWASQNPRREVLMNRHFLMSDMTWGLAYVPGTGGPNSEPQLDGWWVPFLHPGATANIIYPDQSVAPISKDRFIDKFTEDPPDNDEL